MNWGSNLNFEQALRSAVRGEVRFDPVSRAIYATDASHYQIMPACVVVPLDEADVIAATRVAGAFGVPITPRGGGTSLSGQTTWTGMILDVSKHLDQVLELQVEQRRVRVQPGIVRDELNKRLAPHGVYFAPDPATGSRAAVGGMIGNNSSGTRSLIYGRTLEHVIACKVVLVDGSVLTLEEMDAEAWSQAIADGGRLGEICQGVGELLATHEAEIRERFPKVMRRVSGYNLDALLPSEPWGSPGPRNLAHLIVGSEGTLAVLLEATLRLEPLPAATALCVAHFHDIQESLRAVVPMLKHGPSAVEMLDHVVLKEARTNRATAELADFLTGEPQAIQIVEFFGADASEATRRAENLAQDLRAQGCGYAWTVQGDPAAIHRVWEVRKLGLGLVSNVKGPKKGAEFIEDACVPVASLPDYIREVTYVCHSEGVPLTLYAHASVGVLHVRPMLDLHDPEDVRRMERIAEAVFQLVKKYGGAFSGEHGDGLIRGAFVPRFFGPVVYSAFREVKRLFDPQGLMNPGKIIDSPPMTEHLRYAAHAELARRCPPTLFQYREDGSFAEAVEKCNGIGACRKVGSGTMCPSYMATKDEEHSTRGRANALRMAIEGETGPDDWRGARMAEVMDLCLACKACKAECPNGVDMARLKADFLQWRHDAHGVPWGARLIGRLPQAAKWFSGVLAPLVNRIQNLGVFRGVLERIAGIDRRRPLPPFARESLTTWFRHRHRSASEGNRRRDVRVGLFCDTFTNYFEPWVGQHAIELLESCGFDVELVDVGCCQRPAISKGLLRQARAAGTKTARRLAEQAAPLAAVLVLEPSCASALLEDLPDLIAADERTELPVAKTKLLDQFLAEELSSGRLKVRFTCEARELLVHGHCHQKASVGMRPLRTILAHTDGPTIREIEAGCCGMAGSFGYDHYELSRRIGEDRLFPAVRDRAPGAEVIACGLSCRHQLHDFLGVQARHFVELLRVARQD